MANDSRTMLAQSVFPRLDCSRYLDSAEYRKETHDLARRGVGGFVLFAGDVATLPAIIREVRAASPLDLLMAADCENGVTMRFAGGTEFPTMMALGAADDVAATYAVARSIAREMRSIGIEWNFAPVADINTNPDNPIINVRSFGETPDLVARHVHAYIRGMQDEGVAACAKHFPGHGDTSLDSHRDLPVVRHDAKRLETVELAPFREAIAAQVRSIMVAHIVAPALDDDSAPATLSEKITHELLRGRLGFDGIVVTDALDMAAITGGYADGEAAVRAYLAGADVLETMPAPAAALDALELAYRNGRIDEGRLATSTRRLQELRNWVRSFPDAADLETTRQGHDVIALEAARRAARTSGSIGRLYAPLFVIAVADDRLVPNAQEWFDYFSSWYTGEASGAVVTQDVSESDMAEITRCVNAAGTVVLATFVLPSGGVGTVDLAPAQRAVVDHAATRPLVLLNFGNPYLLRDLEPRFRLDAFSACSASLAVSIESIASTIH